MIGKNSPLDRMRQRNRPAVRGRSGMPMVAAVALTSVEENLMREIMIEPMDYMDSPEFRKRDAEKNIYEIYHSFNNISLNANENSVISVDKIR